jgi:hypothetical protein
MNVFKKNWIEINKKQEGVLTRARDIKVGDKIALSFGYTTVSKIRKTTGNTGDPKFDMDMIFIYFSDGTKQSMLPGESLRVLK